MTAETLITPRWPAFIEKQIRDRCLVPDHHQAENGRVSYEFRNGDKRLAIELCSDGSTQTRKVTGAPHAPVAECGELKGEDDIAPLFDWLNAY